MRKRIFSVLLLLVVLLTSFTAFAALEGVEDTKNPVLYIKSASYNSKDGALELTVANKAKNTVGPVIVMFDAEDKKVEIGLEDGFIQELSSSDEKYIPKFDLSGV